jgi:hypothetical protein
MPANIPSEFSDPRILTTSATRVVTSRSDCKRKWSRSDRAIDVSADAIQKSGSRKS